VHLYLDALGARVGSRGGPDEAAPVHEYKGADPLKETQETLRANVGGLFGPLKAGATLHRVPAAFLPELKRIAAGFDVAATRR